MESNDIVPSRGGSESTTRGKPTLSIAETTPSSTFNTADRAAAAKPNKRRKMENEVLEEAKEAFLLSQAAAGRPQQSAWLVLGLVAWLMFRTCHM